MPVSESLLHPQAQKANSLSEFTNIKHTQHNKHCNIDTMLSQYIKAMSRYMIECDEYI